MISSLLHVLDSRHSFIAVLVAHTLSGVFQGVSLALLVPFLASFLTSGRPDARSAVWLLCAVAASVVLSVVGSIIAFKVASFDVCGTLIRKVGMRVQELPLGWFDASATGRVSTATSTSISTLSHLPSIVLPQVASMAGAGAAILMSAAVIDWRLAVAFAVCLPVAFFSLRWLAGSVVAEHRAHVRAMGVLSSRIVEFAQLQPVLRAGDVLAGGWEPLERALVDEYEATRRAGAAKGPAGTLFHAGVQIAMVGAIGIGAFALMGGDLSATTFVAVALMAVRFAEPIGMLAFYVDALHEHRVALDDIEAITEAPVLPEADPASARAPRAPFGAEAEEVSFGYSPDRLVLEGVDVEVPGHSVTALVGPSGCGKSTLLRLIARFWDVDAGSVRVGGADVRDVPIADLMDRVSMVFQDVYLFNTSIEENVRVGRADASDEEVRSACERAGLSEVIDRLPRGLATVVGEGGCALSGGERQRVAIARAFLKDSPILLLDEVTSALDGVNVASVTRSLAELSRGRTVLVIAHRLSTIRRADRIVVLNRGGIEAVGTHEELYAAGGTYRRFWEDQSHVERWRIASSPRA